MLDDLKHETGKKSDKFLNWSRAQRVLIYFNNSISLDKAIELNNIYMDSLTGYVVEIDGAYETLKYLFNKGYYIIIATNGPKIATEDYLIIGDSLKSDIGFAMNCNIDSCWFNKNKEKLSDNYKPTMIIESLKDLINIL